jgi:hypothetical protein
MHDLRFVHANEWTQDRQVGSRFDDAQILERLRGYLAERFPGHQRLRARLLRQSCGNAQHTTAIQNDPIGGRYGADDLLLAITKRHEKESRGVFIARQETGELLGFLAMYGSERVTMKVHKVHMTAAFHHTVRSYWGIHTTRQQTQHHPTHVTGKRRPGCFSRYMRPAGMSWM